MNVVIEGIDPTPFAPLFAVDAETLARAGAIRMEVDRAPGFPCRVTLEDAAPGERVLLLNWEHLPVATPYRSRHAIFVREGARHAARFVDTVPPVLAIRLLSVRGFGEDAMMRDAEGVEGAELAPLIERFLGDSGCTWIDVHNARPGCFAARVRRG